MNWDDWNSELFLNQCESSQEYPIFELFLFNEDFHIWKIKSVIVHKEIIKFFSSTLALIIYLDTYPLHHQVQSVFDKTNTDQRLSINC